MTTIRTWANAIRALWNQPLRKEMMRSGEFIASHLQMFLPYTVVLDTIANLILGVL